MKNGDLIMHLTDLGRAVGGRTDILDSIKVPEGWVVTLDVPDGFWRICNTPAIPLKAIKFFGIFPTPASKEMTRLIKQYGAKIMMIVIPDEDTFEWYSCGPILLSDLERTDNPATLLDESCDLILEDNQELADMKRRAYMMLTGTTDTH